MTRFWKNEAITSVLGSAFPGDCGKQGILVSDVENEKVKQNKTEKQTAAEALAGEATAGLASFFLSPFGGAFPAGVPGLES